MRGESERVIAARFGLAQASVHRHRTSHITDHVVQVHEAKVIQDAKSLIDSLTELHTLTKSLLEEARAEETKNYSSIFAGVRELGRQLDLMHKFEEAREQRSSHPMADPRLIAIFAGLLEVLRPHADAHRAVTRWLEGQRASAPSLPRGDSQKPE